MTPTPKQAGFLTSPGVSGLLVELERLKFRFERLQGFWRAADDKSSQNKLAVIRKD